MQSYDDTSDLPLHLLVKRWEGNIEAPEAAALDAWLAQSADHLRMADAAHRAWLLSADYGAEVPFDREADFEQINRRIEAAGRMKPAGAPAFSRRLWWTSAAAVAAVLVAAVWFLVRPGTPAARWQQVVCEETSKREITLPDGSRVWLRRGARLDFPRAFHAAGERLVKLSGEAFFEVSHRADHPFRVQTEQTSVVVLGTSFAVRAVPGVQQTSVFLKTGKVRFTPREGGQTALLLPGNKAVFNHESRALRVTARADTNDIAWQSGRLAFQDAPFAEVLQALEVFYDKKIILRETALRGCRITATFREDRWAEAQAVLQTALGVSVVEGPEGVVLSGGACR